MIPRRHRKYRQQASHDWRRIALGVMADLNLNDASATLAFAKNLDNPVDSRAASLIALGAFPGNQHVSDILGILRHAEAPSLSLAAAQALAAIQSRQATRPLVRTIRSATADHIAFSCVYALWSLRDRRSKLAIQEVVNNAALSPKTRGLAAEVLGIFRRSLPLLLALQSHPIPDVRCGALYGAAAITADKRLLRQFEVLLCDQSTVSGGQTVSELAARILQPQ